MSEGDRKVHTDPWTGVTYRLEAGEKAPPRPRLTDSCLRFLNLHASFEDQRQPGSMARQHIDDCPQCRQYIARKEWERKKEEELLSSPDVEALVAEYAKRFRVPVWQRRRVQLAAGLIVLILGSLWLLYSFLATRSAEGSASQAPYATLTVSPTPTLDRLRETDRTALDRSYQDGGVLAINKVFSDGSEMDVLKALDWIRDRQVLSMIPTVVGALTDPRIEVRRKATLTLLRLPPLSIKPFQSALNSAASTESDPVVAAGMQKLATRVAQAR